MRWKRTSSKFKIMVPFTFEGIYTIKSLQPAGTYTAEDTIAVLIDEAGVEHSVTMTQKMARQASNHLLQ